MKLRIVNLNTNKGTVLASRILEYLRQPPKGLPPVGGNEDHTDAGDPHSYSMPPMPYSTDHMITGSGFGPVVGREPRELS